MVRAGERISGRYVVEARLARGGMADVYRARDISARRPVALKILRPAVADPRRFERETRLLGRLQHPNLVRLLDTGLHGELPYLVLDLVEGPTLEQRLDAGPVAPDEARRIGRDIAQALAYVHGRGVVHRDVKPSNILLAPGGRALLTDFGVAQLGDATRLTATDTTMGTAAYVAPEQLGTGEVTAAVDIYSLGLVLLEALTGTPGFTGTRDELLAARLAAAPAVPTDLPSSWVRLLRSMTARDPALRPASGAVASQLAAPPPAVDPPAARAPTEPLATAPPAVHDSQPATAPAAHPIRQPVMWALGGAMAVLTAVAVLVASAERGATPPEPATTTMATTTSSTTSTSTTSTTQPDRDDDDDEDEDEGDDRRGESAALCADIDAQKQAIDARKQLVDETYRDDKEAREQLKRQLEDQKQAFDAQKRSLGC